MRQTLVGSVAARASFVGTATALAITTETFASATAFAITAETFASATALAITALAVTIATTYIAHEPIAVHEHLYVLLVHHFRCLPRSPLRRRRHRLQARCM